MKNPDFEFFSDQFPQTADYFRHLHRSNTLDELLAHAAS